MVTKKNYKYVKKNKRSRTRRQRHRRRQMRGGELSDVLNFFRPKVETNDTCAEEHNKCLDRVAGKDDSLFKMPNLFGTTDDNAAAAPAPAPAPAPALAFASASVSALGSASLSASVPASASPSVSVCA